MAASRNIPGTGTTPSGSLANLSKPLSTAPGTNRRAVDRAPHSAIRASATTSACPPPATADDGGQPHPVTTPTSAIRINSGSRREDPPHCSRHPRKFRRVVRTLLENHAYDSWFSSSAQGGCQTTYRCRTFSEGAIVWLCVRPLAGAESCASSATSSRRAVPPAVTRVHVPLLWS